MKKFIVTATKAQALVVIGIVTVPNSETIRPRPREKKEGKFDRFEYAETRAEIRPEDRCYLTTRGNERLKESLL